jgi:lipopolysaccharide/colanic/teichoic acid biosynthesis glycosyltransferase
VRQRGLPLAAKRALDLLGAAAGLVLLSPLLAFTALAVRLTLGGPVLFRQERPGLGGRIFTLVKFRTMREPRPGEARFLTDEQRITRLGRFLRTSSIDELPELWNVLRGEMSLVGPRPLLVEYLERYTPEQRRRHDVLPGLTGWTAVNGRHSTTFAQRLELDLWYVDHWSPWLDLRILALTAYHLVRHRNVEAIEDRARVGFPGEDPAARGREPPAAGAPGGRER